MRLAPTESLGLGEGGDGKRDASCTAGEEAGVGRVSHELSVSPLVRVVVLMLSSLNIQADQISPFPHPERKTLILSSPYRPNSN